MVNIFCTIITKRIISVNFHSIFLKLFQVRILSLLNFLVKSLRCSFQMLLSSLALGWVRVRLLLAQVADLPVNLLLAEILQINSWISFIEMRNTNNLSDCVFRQNTFQSKTIPSLVCINEMAYFVICIKWELYSWEILSIRGEPSI